MNEPMLKTETAAISSAEFFDRARARLDFDIPAGLTDAQRKRLADVRADRLGRATRGLDLRDDRVRLCAAR